MEKSEQKRSDSQLKSWEMPDTRPVNGKRLDSSRRSTEDPSPAIAEREGRSLGAMLSLISYWLKELIWRARFWYHSQHELE